MTFCSNDRVKAEAELTEGVQVKGKSQSAWVEASLEVTVIEGTGERGDVGGGAALAKGGALLELLIELAKCSVLDDEVHAAGVVKVAV